MLFIPVCRERSGRVSSTYSEAATTVDEEGAAILARCLGGWPSQSVPWYPKNGAIWGGRGRPPATIGREQPPSIPLRG
jgi:DNA-binding protein H-NS